MRRLVDALGLHAQDDDHVGAGERFFDSRLAANIRRETFELARHPHRRAAESDARAEFAEQMNIRSALRGYEGCLREW